MLEAVRNNKQAQHSGKFLIKPVLHKILMFCSNWLIMNPSSLVIDTVAAWWLVSCNYPDINIKTLLWSTSSAPWSAQQHCITYITCHQSAGPYLRLKITGVTRLDNTQSLWHSTWGSLWSWYWASWPSSPGRRRSRTPRLTALSLSPAEDDDWIRFRVKYVMCI